jgi:uncharacterized protein (DUF302 family)
MGRLSPWREGASLGIELPHWSGDWFGFDHYNASAIGGVVEVFPMIASAVRNLPRLMVLALVLVATPLPAAPEAVYRKPVPLSFDAAYRALYAALEDKKFWVVFEADLLARMRRFADRWGEDFNRHDLTAARVMVFCNIWWTNRIANADPSMLAMCPLHLAVIEQDGQTVILMLRPSILARDSEAETVAGTLEAELIGLIERTFD